MQKALTSHASASDRIALALIEAMIPAGRQIPAADAEALVRQVNDWLAGHPVLRASLSSGLYWLEARTLTRGTRFSKLPVAARQQVLANLARTTISGQLLRAIGTPYKAAWLFDDNVQQKLGSRTPVSVPSQIETFAWQQQITRAEDLDEDLELDADVVIIGTGAGGAAAAYELACRGLAVVMIEEGNYYNRLDFNGRVQDMIPKLYRSLGVTSAIGNVIIPVPIGRNVGGTTTINSGTCMRTPDAVLHAWQDRGIDGLSPEQMAPWFDGVEEMLGVTRAEERYVGEIGNVMRDGARAIGFTQMHPLRRNAPGCDGQGLCQFGCPTDAKRSTNVSYVPRALERGAFLFTGLRAEQLLHERQQINGLVAHTTKASGKSVRVRFNTSQVIVATGSLLTPLFLQQNGVRNAHLGKHLTLHPCGVVNGVFGDRQFANSATIPQGFGIADMADQGLMFEGGTVPLAGHGLFNSFYGDEFVRFCEQYQNTGYFGFMIKDTSEGSVQRGPHRDLPLIRYHMNERDFALFKKGVETLAQMFLAAGADEVILPGLRHHQRIRNSEQLARWMHGKRSPRDFLMSAYHPLGTARIAASDRDGVCNSDHQVFGWEGLYVMDGSSVPSSLGANPQVTIMAMAARAAARLADRLNQTA